MAPNDPTGSASDANATQSSGSTAETPEAPAEDDHWHPRRSLQERLKEATALLVRLGHDPDLVNGLSVSWPDSEPVVDVPDATAKILGPQFDELRHPIAQPSAADLEAEIQTLRARGVPDEEAVAVAHVKLAQKAIDGHHEVPSQLASERPPWIAAKAAAIAAAALEHLHDPRILDLAFEYLERQATIIHVARLAESKRLAAEALKEVGQRDSKRRSRGGSHPKELEGVAAMVEALLGKLPTASAREIWELIPNADGYVIDPTTERKEPVVAAGFEVYRAQNEEEQEVLEQVNGPRPDATITFNTFRGYVTRARKRLCLRNK